MSASASRGHSDTYGVDFINPVEKKTQLGGTKKKLFMINESYKICVGPRRDPGRWEIDARGEVRLCFDGVALKKGGLITIINNVSGKFFVRAVQLVRFLGVFLCWRACWW